ncbi:MAG: hypothetical protein ACXW2P_02640 [Thermoanaerobaculia bacterium]
MAGVTLAAALFFPAALSAQAPEPVPEPVPTTEEAAAPQEEQPEEPTLQELLTPEQAPVPPADPPPVLSDAASSSFERRESLPDVNIYLPEMQMSIRLRKLIRNALFESQIDYEFINGDISTYLRYKYYSRNYTYRLGVFDTIEFPSVGESSTQEFERVRGGLLLVGVPKDYDERYFWLVQGDNISFGDLRNVDNRRKNFYTKVAYQYGTQFDERLNGIVGESRGRITPVLTAFRDIGPQRSSYAVALTQTFNVTGGDLDLELDKYEYMVGDYRYTKLEAEGLNRFDIRNSFVFSRIHFGAFAGYDEFTNRGDRPEPERYTVPRYELFRLGGREALRAIGENDDSIGTHEIHITNEYFRPIFRNRDYKMGPLHWNTLYGIGYMGAGIVGFGFDSMTKTDQAVIDAGLGFEASITVRDFEVLLGVLWASTIKAPGCPVDDSSLDCRDLKGGKFRYSVRTIR